MSTKVLAAACFSVSLAVASAQQEVLAQPINLIINKAVKNVGIPDPDPVIIGEFGYNIAFTAKVSATTRKIFFKAITHKDRATGLDLFLRPFEIGSSKFPLKRGSAVKGEIDNYVYEENPTNDTEGVAFFHEKGKGIYRAQATSKSASIFLLKKTDTDKTGVDPDQMASGLCILDSEGKYPPSVEVTSRNYFYPYVLFAAPDKKKGKELWLSDGTPGGTKVFMDLNPTFSSVMNPRTHKNVQVPNGSGISAISAYFPDLGDPTSYGGSAYFTAFDGTGYDVYRVDSIQDAPKKQPRVTVTTIFQRLVSFNLEVNPTKLSATPLGVMFALPTVTSNGVEELWGYDPANDANGPQLFSTGATLVPTNSEFRTGFQFGDTVGYYFSGVLGSDGREPLQAGFDTGTPFVSSLGNLAASSAASNPRDFTQVGGTVFFVANPGTGEHLYRSNGNAGGTEDLGRFDNVHDITADVDRFASGDEEGTRVYFVANDNTGTPVLWRSTTIDSGLDGTPVQIVTTGGHPVKNPTHLRRLVGNGVYYLFFVCDGVGTEYENITPAKGDPFPAQHQVWYCGRFFDNNP